MLSHVTHAIEMGRFHVLTNETGIYLALQTSLNYIFLRKFVILFY